MSHHFFGWWDLIHWCVPAAQHKLAVAQLPGRHQLQFAGTSILRLGGPWLILSSSWLMTVTCQHSWSRFWIRMLDRWQPTHIQTWYTSSSPSLLTWDSVLSEGSFPRAVNKRCIIWLMTITYMVSRYRLVWAFCQGSFVLASNNTYVTSAVNISFVIRWKGNIHFMYCGGGVRGVVTSSHLHISCFNEVCHIISRTFIVLKG